MTFVALISVSKASQNISRCVCVLCSCPCYMLSDKTLLSKRLKIESEDILLVP